MPTAGFWITSTAPYSSARSTVSAPFFASAEQTRTGNWLVGHDLLEERQTVHVRHLDVEHDDVGPPLLHLAHRDQRMRRGVHMDAHLARQHGGHHLPHDGGVIDDEDVQRVGGRYLFHVGSPAIDGKSDRHRPARRSPPGRARTTLGPTLASRSVMVVVVSA